MNNIIIGVALILLNVIIAIPYPSWYTVVGCTFAGIAMGFGIAQLIIVSQDKLRRKL